MATGAMIGEPLRRREDDRILRGQTRYLDDLSRPGQAHAAFVRSPHASARIASITVPDGLAADVTVLSASDLAPLRAFPVAVPGGAEVQASEAHPVLAEHEVRYAGQPVAIVIAPSRARAEDALELVEVEYEPRPVVLAPRESELRLMRWSAGEGDVDRAFADAAHLVSGRYALPRLAAAPIEARGCLAEFDPVQDLLTVWCSAQDVHRPLAQLAHILERSPDSIRVIVPDVGGAFGSKGVIAPEVAAAAAAAVRLGRPIKWTEDRLENLIGSYQGRGIEGDLELALDGDGRMLALRARLWADLGGYLLSTTAIPPHTAGTLIAGCYDIRVAEVEVLGMRTHKVPTGPYRGAGRPDATYMLEALVDQAARQTGIDPVSLRRRNLIRRFPHRTPTGLEYDSGDFERCLDLALELAGERPASPPGAPAGVLAGRGVALYVERAGGAFESAAIELKAGGRFVISSSSSPHGQGHDITFAQIAAERLRVGVAQLELRFGDSASSPPGTGTFGSRSVAQAGSAVAQAADQMVAEGRRRAAARLGTRPEAVELNEAGFRSAEAAASGARRRPRAVSWKQLAAEGELRATARFASGQVFSSGAHVADVTIDSGTGELAVGRLVAVDDAGTLINPLLAHGQVIGGAVQALGECLTEKALFDDSGQPRSGSFLDYGLLTAAEIPPIVTGEVQTPSPLNPLGAKGAGEGGAVGALAAVAGAVTDALGGRQVAPPFTAETLWRALAATDALAPARPLAPVTPEPSDAATPGRPPASPPARRPRRRPATILAGVLAVALILDWLRRR